MENSENPMPVLYEDAFCMIVAKPPDLLVHHSRYARNITEKSLVELLLEQTGSPKFPVHRLDRKTSGVILLCKSRENVSAFQSLFENAAVEKKYHALLRGHTSDGGTIDSPVKNDRGNYKEALTNYRTLERYLLEIPVVPYAVSRYSVVEFLPQTGRMHQLRIHANKISHPIIGDPKYGNRHHNHMFAGQLGIPHLFLHAASLRFVHPFLGTEIYAHAPRPEFWNRFLDREELQVADS